MENTSRFRRPLFTESQRKGLNSSLVRSLRNVDPGHALSELDEQAIEAQPADYPLSRGPFGVFPVQTTKFNHSPTSISTDTTPVTDSQVLMNDLVDPALADAGETASILDPATFELGVDDALEDSTVLDHDPISLAGSLLLHDIGSEDSVARLYETYENTHFDALDGPIPFHSFLFPNPQGSRFPGDSWLLLANYRDKVVPLLSPLNPSAKSPWHHLILPCAMNTMAEMTMGGTTSHARSALLHALLATSASHIQLSSFTSPEDSWNLTSHYYKQRARHDLRRCLQEEASSRVKKAKYKDILMALLSMAILNVFDADADSLLACLLVTEKYISRKGLSKPSLSRKARLLHHCYAYLRIFNESVVLSDVSTDPFHDLGVALDPVSTAKAPRFRISRWSDTPDFALATVKSIELGHHDLHLEHPARWDLTMYPEIFGIPESFLSLMSHVTRLGNERDLLMSGRLDGPSPNTRDFLLRAKLVEEHICRWDPAQDPESSSQNLPMMLAMQKALLIFFYRRFYDVQTTTLQQEVREVRDLLLTSKTASHNVYMIWPGFIAACEALGPDLQDYYRGWFTDCFRNTGLPSFQVAKSIAESIWTSGRGGQERSLQWPDVVRSSGQRLVLF
ncbi:fungal specific transcription factor domain-containing protein [Aspergillus melleus]|uniref:fungal specific transcription factor domain-containing protein n=1 Tax=Aspergillus melleus TaxID=138277 RepID=UPI001E8D4F29|nr:uncharacterized protein LDX57_001777 [Aspergillus melleus]KAH8424022.1 hypothetical protein LDX57_001777 [Aspergillus melleus]